MISSLNKTQERGALGVFADFQGLPGITGLQGSKGGVGLEARRLRSSINLNTARNCAAKKHKLVVQNTNLRYK